MDHWPEWGMPVENWQQQGSYVSPIEEALPDPAAGTLVCIPPLNPALLKYIAGCLDQLRNPSTYDGLSDADIALSLQRADTLRGLVGHPVACGAAGMYEVRLNACVLEQSTDGGATWSTVAGWDGLAACLPGMVTDAIAIPANPLGVSTTQQGCNISGYVAQQIIQGVLSTLQQAISEGRSVIQFATDLVIAGKAFSYVLPITTAALLGIDALLALGASIGASELATIAADVVLWDDITCAIFQAIRADGHITASNWVTAIANVRAISYSVPGVSGGIADWLQSVDMATVYEWQQLAPLDSVDCTSCDRWCYKFDFTTGAHGATTFGPYGGHYVAGVGFVSTVRGGTVLESSFDIALGASVAITDIEIEYATNGTLDAASQTFEYRSGTEQRRFPLNTGNTGGAYHTSGDHTADTVDEIAVVLRDNNTADTITIRSFEIAGHGANPFGSDNCTYPTS